MTAPVIAVVDDDVYIGDMLQELLTREGYEVLRAYSGTETLLLLESRKPDLILLDLMLPGLSGEAVLPHLAGSCPQKRGSRRRYPCCWAARRII